MVGLKRTLPGRVLLGSDIDATIAFTWKTVSQLEFEIGDVPVSIVNEIGATAVGFSDQVAVLNKPVSSGLWMTGGPAVEGLTIENGNEFRGSLSHGCALTCKANQKSRQKDVCMPQAACRKGVLWSRCFHDLPLNWAR